MTAFTFPVRVYYEDTDAGGVVYHSTYLNFFERARTELIRGAGINQAELLAGGRGHAFAVRRAEVDYLKPARLDDLLTVKTRLAGVGGASLDFDQNLCRDGVQLARARVTVAFISLDGRPARIPSELRVSLRELVSERRESHGSCAVG